MTTPYIPPVPAPETPAYHAPHRRDFLFALTLGKSSFMWCIERPKPTGYHESEIDRGRKGEVVVD